MPNPKYVNIPAPWLPETLTMVRPKKDICGADVINEALRVIGVDEAVGKDSLAIGLVNLNKLCNTMSREVDKAFALDLELLNATSQLPTASRIEGYSKDIYNTMCFGVCQPQRPQRKHVDSTIVEPKQLT